MLEQLVREFVKMRVSVGGMSYWDPVRSPERDLTAAAMSYLLSLERVFPFQPPDTSIERVEQPR
jgi:hypothetical protein